MRSLLTRGLAALVLAGTLAAVAPAHAETVVVRDPRGDVTRVDPGPEGGTKLSPARHRPSADITRVAVRHGWKRLSIAVSLRDLRRAEDAVLDVRLKLPGGAGALVSSFSSGRRWSGFAYYFDESDARQCKAWTTPRPARDRLVVTVPRRCLDRPEWVRASVQFVTLHGEGQAEFGYADAAGGPVTWNDARRSFGPKVRVG